MNHALHRTQRERFQLRIGADQSHVDSLINKSDDKMTKHSAQASEGVAINAKCGSDGQ